MMSTSKISRRAELGWRLLVGAALLILLAACGDLGGSEAPVAPDRFAYTLTVAVDADDHRAAVEADYGASVVVWRPDAGFAVLGLDADSAEFGAQARRRSDTTSTSSPEPVYNLDQLVIPEAFANGFTSWSGGFTSWSGGFSSWSGGSPEPTTFAENVPLWQQIRLAEGQQLATNLGAGVTVAVIDTGIDLDHPAFAGRLAPQSDWRDFVDGDEHPMDEAGGSASGHGTAVAGIVIQVAPRATILPIRVLKSDGAGDVDHVVAAIDHAIAVGADVINLSLGTDADVPALEAMMQYAASQQVVVTASAGNSGDENVTYPAAYDFYFGDAEFTLSVGSVDLEDRKSSFSTYGTALAITAPGEFVYTLAPGGQIGYWSGTSMSAPIVAGAAALGIAQATAPWHLAELPWYLTMETDLIDRFNREYRHELGSGRLNVLNFIDMGFY